MNPLSGCGQSPPFPPRDGCVDSVASWSAKGYASVLPARLSTVPDGQSAPTPLLAPAIHPKIRRANSEAPLPRRGKQRRFRTLAAYPCPRRARMRHSTRRLLPPPPQPNRTAAHPPPAHGAGVRQPPRQRLLACGTAAARSKDHIFENPFGKTSIHLPRHPVPQNPPQTASPCSWACRREHAPPPQPNPHRSTPAPCSWGGCASTPRRRHWLPALPAGRRHCRHLSFFRTVERCVALQWYTCSIYIHGMGGDYERSGNVSRHLGRAGRRHQHSGLRGHRPFVHRGRDPLYRAHLPHARHHPPRHPLHQAGRDRQALLAGGQVPRQGLPLPPLERILKQPLLCPTACTTTPPMSRDYINEDTAIYGPGRISFAEAIPGLMVSLGFLGTLIGLTTGLSGFDMADAESVQQSIVTLIPRHALCLHDLHCRRGRLHHLHADHALRLRLGRAHPAGLLRRHEPLRRRALLSTP